MVSECKILMVDLVNILENKIPETPAAIFDLRFSESQFGTINPYPNTQIDSDSIKFHFSSPYQPDIMFKLYLPTSSELSLPRNSAANSKFSKLSVKQEILSQVEVKGAPAFSIERIDIPSSDYGISIPVTLLTPQSRPFNLARSFFSQGANKYIQKNQLNQKLLIKSYGCYGLNLDVHYSPSDLYLLSRGFSIAYAHVRGGSELGN